MIRIPIGAIKANIVFPAGQLPAIKPADPAFVLDLGGVTIAGKVNPKAARKLAQHPGGAVLQGKLIANGGKLRLLEAGFTWIEPKAEAGPAAPQQSTPGPETTADLAQTLSPGK